MGNVGLYLESEKKRVFIHYLTDIFMKEEICAFDRILGDNSDLREGAFYRNDSIR